MRWNINSWGGQSQPPVLPFCTLREETQRQFDCSTNGMKQHKGPRQILSGANTKQSLRSGGIHFTFYYFGECAAHFFSTISDDLFFPGTFVERIQTPTEWIVVPAEDVAVLCLRSDQMGPCLHEQSKYWLSGKGWMSVSGFGLWFYICSLTHLSKIFKQSAICPNYSLLLPISALISAVLPLTEVEYISETCWN